MAIINGWLVWSSISATMDCPPDLGYFKRMGQDRFCNDTKMGPNDARHVIWLQVCLSFFFEFFIY